MVNAPAPPMDRIARKTALIERYLKLREPQRAEREQRRQAAKAAQAPTP